MPATPSMSLITWTRTARDDNVTPVETGLAGKRVLVTGGAGGIGSACVRAFAAEGARVGVHYRTSRGAGRGARRETGARSRSRPTSPARREVDRLFEAAERGSGGSTSARRSPGSGRATTSRSGSCSLERWEATLRANLTATFLTARGFLREVERTGHGSLVLVGSTAGRFGEAGHADYAAAKAAIQVGLLLSLKNEIVRIAPRGARERRRARLDVLADDARRARRRRSSTALTRTMALRKVAAAEDVARAVVVLASDELSATSPARSSPSRAAWKARTLLNDERRRRRRRTPAAERVPSVRRRSALSASRASLSADWLRHERFLERLAAGTPIVADGGMGALLASAVAGSALPGGGEPPRARERASTSTSATSAPAPS